MKHDPDEMDQQDESEGGGGYDPFTSRGPEYDEAWAPFGDRYERNLDDRYSRTLDFTDLDYVDESDE